MAPVNLNAGLNIDLNLFGGGGAGGSAGAGGASGGNLLAGLLRLVEGGGSGGASAGNNHCGCGFDGPSPQNNNGNINLNINISFGDCCNDGCGGSGSGGLTCDANSNSVTTSGGYKVVAEGNTNWKVYNPDGSLLTEVSGDPHVTEGDGTKWDFSKDSAFTLPDGSTIYCDTSAQTGHSVTQGLTVVSGDQRVDITGVDKNPTTSQVYNYGGRVFEQMQDMVQGHNFDHYQASTNGDQVQWTKDGEGVVTGSEYDGNSYVQKCDPSQQQSGGLQALESALLAALFSGNANTLSGSQFGGGGGLQISISPLNLNRDQFVA
jgi:hypothetical protein